MPLFRALANDEGSSPLTDSPNGVAQDLRSGQLVTIHQRAASNRVRQPRRFGVHWAEPLGTMPP